MDRTVQKSIFKSCFRGLVNSFLFRTGSNAGVVLGYTSLIIVTARTRAGKKHEILEWGKETYGEGITRNSPEFPDVLRKILSRYVKDRSRTRIWCTIQSKGVETRFLVLPDMPAKHLTKGVFWSFKKEVELGDDPIVFDYDVTGTRQSQDKKEIEVLACAAPIKELSGIKDLFKRAGWPVAGITVTSFAFQNLFRTGFAGEGSQNIGTLFIGADWSRIDIFSKGNLILSRDIKTGTRSMTEVLDDHRVQAPDDGISMERYLEEETGSSASQGENNPEKTDNKSESQMIRDQLMLVIQEGTLEQQNQVFSLILPVVDRLIRQIERTFEHFTMTMKGERVERLYFTGPMCGFEPLMAYTRSQLGIPALTINPFENHQKSASESVLKINERDEFVPASGLALSENEYTLNFNFTYEDKQEKKTNRFITQCLVVAIVLVTLTGFILHHRITSGQTAIEGEIRALTQELAVRDIQYGKNGIIDYSSRIRGDKNKLTQQAAHHAGAAILAEISLLTPAAIRLSSFLYEENTGEPTPRSLQVKGIVSDQNRKVLDDYFEKIKSTRLIKNVTLTHLIEKDVDNRKIYYFEATMELYD